MARLMNKKGFTLIELVFAMAGFSIMLVVAVSGFLNAVAIYNQANVSRDNQQQVRGAMEQMSVDIRSAKGSAIKLGTDNTWLCLTDTSRGDIVYYGTGLGSADGVLRVRRLADTENCTDHLSGAVENSNDTVVLSNALEFKVTQLVQSESIQSVRVLLSRRLGSEASARARQFSNAFSLQSTYLHRGGL